MSRAGLADGDGEEQRSGKRRGVPQMGTTDCPGPGGPDEYIAKANETG